MYVEAGSHPLCTASNGSVDIWGRGDNGQGLGDDWSNKLVRVGLQNEAVVQVAAGRGHSSCVTGDGSVCTRARGETTVGVNWAWVS